MRSIFLTADLLFSSRVEQLAKHHGSELRVVASPVSASDAITEDSRLLIVDLTIPGLDVGQIVSKVRAANPNVHIVAYGPHVQTGKLDAARTAGCDEVMSRGQFDREFARLITDTGRS